MLIYFTSRVISSTAAFLYPGYASFKTLSQRPASEEELERWLMYWSVLGVIVGIEYVAEWLISWLPLYYPMKTIFLLYLSLPQTQGSSYIYINYLQPFLHYHEADIDATIGKLKAKIYSYLQERFRVVWNALLGSLGQPPLTGASATADTAQPPTVQDPVSGPAQILGGLWQSYGPSIVASGASLFTMASAAAAVSQAQRPTLNSQPPSQARVTSSSSRRGHLEAELAPSDENHSGSDSDNGVAMPRQHGSSAYSRTGSDADLRSRGGQYEEVEVPSDVEGYDVGPTTRRPGGADRQTSWFGWGGAGAPSEKKRE